MIHRPVQQRHPVLGTGFAEDIAHVVVHRALADHQRFADLLIGQSLGDQRNDLQLPLGELQALLAEIAQIRHRTPV